MTTCFSPIVPQNPAAAGTVTMAEEKIEMDNMEPLMEEHREEPVRGFKKFERIFQPCIAEIIGTTLFVFIGCVSVIENVEAAGRLQPALVHGLAVAVLIACLAEISGSHFNPPFTMAIYLCGGIELFLIVPYVACQLTGGLIGAAMAKLMTSNENYAKAHGAAFTILQSNEQLLQVLFLEISMTGMVTMVVLLGAINGQTKGPLIPFLVGSAVIICVLAGGDISGTCMNPARAMGPALMTGYWAYHWVYWVGPITGSLIAVALVRLLLGDKKMRVLWK